MNLSQILERLLGLSDEERANTLKALGITEEQLKEMQDEKAKQDEIQKKEQEKRQEEQEELKRLREHNKTLLDEHPRHQKNIDKKLEEERQTQQDQFSIKEQELNSRIEALEQKDKKMKQDILEKEKKAVINSAKQKFVDPNVGEVMLKSNIKAYYNDDGLAVVELNINGKSIAIGEAQIIKAIDDVDLFRTLTVSGSGRRVTSSSVVSNIDKDKMERLAENNPSAYEALRRMNSGV